MFQSPGHPLVRYSTAVLSVGVSLILTFVLWPVIAPYRLILFYPAVAFSGWYGGVRCAVVAVLLSMLAVIYFLIPPVHTFVVTPSEMLQLIIFALVCLFIVLLTEARRRSEITAWERFERYNVTLFSIGDAVIVTDDHGRVTFMNPIAEALTGWTEKQASEQHLDTVFKIVNEATRAAVESPVAKVMQEGTVVGLANHTILLAKDGRDVPIDDSGAPIRDAQGNIVGVVLVFRDVAERRATELMQGQLAAIVEYSSDAIFGKTLDGIITSWNRGAEEMYGYTAAEAIGKPVAMLTPLDRPDETPSILERLRAGVPVERLETARLRKDGTLLDVSLTISPIKDSTGQVIAASTIARDVTDRKRMERKLHETNQALRALIEGSPVAIIVFDPDGIVRLWSPAAEQIFGWKVEEVIGRPMPTIPANKQDEFHKMREAMLRGETLMSVEARRQRKDGSPIDIDFYAVGIPNTEGQIDQLMTIATDISERKRAEQELRESEARFRTIADTAPVFLWMTGADGLCHFFNKGWLDFTGRTLEQELGNGWAEGLYPADHQRVRDVRQSSFNDRLPFEMEYRLRNAKGEYCWILDHGVPRFTSDGTFLGYIGSCIDISERKRREEIQAFLSQASQVLSSSLDYQTTLASVARLAVPNIADWCTVHIQEEDGSLQEVAVAHVDPDKIKWARELARHAPPPDPNAPQGMYAVLRTGKPEIYPDIPDELLVAVARNETELNILREIGYSSVIVMPLRVGDKTIGVLQFVATNESGRHYGDADMALAEELARLAAVSVDNARLYRAAQQARDAAERSAERTARLQAITAALAQVLDPAQAAKAVIDQLLPALGASRGLVGLLAEDGQAIDVVYVSGYSETTMEQWMRMPLSQSLPITDAVRTGQPFFVNTPDKWLAAYPTLASSPTSQSLAVLPLMLDDHAIGAMVISFREQQSFDADTQAYMMALAQQCAQGIDRARLYAERQAYAQTLEKKVTERTDQLQQALIVAQSADRAKGTLLATVSHEMRTPLSSIIGFSNLILGRKPDQQKLTEYTTFINLEARRLANLINDFLDLQRIESGREVFRFGDLDMTELVQDIIAKHTLDESNAHPIRTTIEAVPSVRGDSNRIRQVILNLLSNALKFSPAGSEIDLSLRRVGREVVFAIHDAGIGIPQEEQGKLFENFFRGDAAERNRIPGTGLGLALCRRIIDAHEGRIWAESEGLNQGSTFSFALPVSNLAAVEQPPDSPHEQGARNLIAVIEDDENFSKYLSECLTPEGYVVRVIHFREVTLDLLAQLDPILIVLDIFRGKEQVGWPLLATIKQHPRVRNIPVMVCSIVGDSGQAAELGASSYVSKPVDENFLFKEIHRLVGAPPNRVLVVDDDEAIRAMLQDMMAEAGYQTEIVVDGQDAIERLKQAWPDLIILDLLMPNVDGFTVLEWIRIEQGNRDIPIIAFTAAELTPSEQKILKDRANMVAVKSHTTPQQLLAIIKRTIQVAPAHH